MNENKLKSIISEYTAEAILNPEWENAGRVNDWRNYIPEKLQEIWNDLSCDAKIIAYYMADEMAGREEWD